MTPPARGFLFVIALSVMPAAQSDAIPFDGNPKALIHIVPAPSKNPCGLETIDDCRSAVTGGSVASDTGPFYLAYLLLARGFLDGIAAVQCGISYEDNRPGDMSNGRGIDIFEWKHCAVIDLPAPIPPVWPEPGGANIVLWGVSDCQTEETAVAGYFYLAAYSADSLFVMPWPFDGRLVVADCTALETVIEKKALGLASFTPGAVEPGCNPCLESCPGPELPPAPPPPAAPKLLLHVSPAGTTPPCRPSPVTDCGQAVTRGGLSAPGGPFHFVHLLVSKSTAAFEVGSLRCGIYYESGRAGDSSNGRGIDVFSWTLCGTEEITGAGVNPWPEPGGGNRIILGKCPTTAVAHAGYFYVAAYSPDRLQIIPYPSDEPTDVRTCGGYSFGIDERFLGSAAFSAGGSSEGCNPCRTDCSVPTSVQTTTWSGIKRLFPRPEPAPR